MCVCVLMEPPKGASLGCFPKLLLAWFLLCATMETARTLRTGQKNGLLLASTRIYLVAPERGGWGFKGWKSWTPGRHVSAWGRGTTYPAQVLRPSSLCSCSSVTIKQYKHLGFEKEKKCYYIYAFSPVQRTITIYFICMKMRFCRFIVHTSSPLKMLSNCRVHL